MASADVKWPTFLIIGAAKSGTTTVYEYLDKHPQVFMSALKEPFFLGIEGRKLDRSDRMSMVNKWGISDRGEYEQLFRGAGGYPAVGEASTLYIYSPEAIAGIKRYVPDARLIAILRNPVDRAFSNYMMMVRDDREPIGDFWAAFNAEDERKRAGWEYGYHYRSLGFYYEQLRRYYDAFPREQVRVFLFEDVTRAIKTTMRDIYRFIGVDEDFEVTLDIHSNISGVPRRRWLFNLTDRPNPLKALVKSLLPEKVRKPLAYRIKTGNLDKPRMSAETRAAVRDVYRADIIALQDLIGRDLSGWLKG